MNTSPTGLVDHLLVQLTDPGRPLPHQVDAEQAPVGDGAAGGDGQPLGARAADNWPSTPVPVQPGRSSANSSEGYRPDSMSRTLSRARCGAARRTAPPAGPAPPGHRCSSRPWPPWPRSAGRARPGVAGIAHGLDGPGPHALDDHRALDQVAAELGEDDAAADRAHLVAGPADALQAGRDRAERLHLDDQVDGAHVDAQLSELVATTAGRRPALRSSSISVRCSRLTEPWWAGPARCRPAR